MKLNYWPLVFCQLSCSVGISPWDFCCCCSGQWYHYSPRNWLLLGLQLVIPESQINWPLVFRRAFRINTRHKNVLIMERKH